MRNKFGLVVTALLVAALALPCAALASSGKVIKIGAIYPLTGGAAAAGRVLRAGAELAAEIANGKVEGIDMDMAKKAGIASMGGAKSSSSRITRATPSWARTWPSSSSRTKRWWVFWAATTAR